MKPVIWGLAAGLVMLTACSGPVDYGTTCDPVEADDPIVTDTIVGATCNDSKNFCINIYKLKKGGTRHQIRNIGARTVVRVFKPAVVEVTIEDNLSLFLVNERAAFENKYGEARCKAR